MTQKKFPWKTVVSIFLSFLIFIGVTTAVCLFTVLQTAFEKESFLKAYRASGYAEGSTQTFADAVYDLSIPLGLPESISKDLLQSNDFSRDQELFISTALAGGTYTSETDALQQEVVRRVQDYFSGMNQTISENQQSVLIGFSQQVGQEYDKLVRLPLVQYFGGIQTAYRKYIAETLIGVGAVVILCIVGLLRLHVFGHHALRYVSYSLLASALLLGGFSGTVLFSGFVRQLNLTPDYFKAFWSGWLENALVRLFTGALAVLLLFFCTLLLTALLRRRLEKRLRSGKN